MTASITITNTSDHDTDVTLEVSGGHSATIGRGKSYKLGFPERPLIITATAPKPGVHDYLGELYVTARPIDYCVGLNFGQALELVKAGKRVRRAGWNGKDMHVYLAEPYRDGLMPCLVMHTAQGMEQPGWLASQADMLATDWRLVE